MKEIKKWFTCFIEFQQEDGSWALSQIPWRILLIGILSKIFEKDDFKWNWVPPWRVGFTKS